MRNILYSLIHHDVIHLFYPHVIKLVAYFIMCIGSGFTSTPLTMFCMLTSAPLSNSTLIHSTCPAAEAFFSAVSPCCNVSSCEYHQSQIQIQYNNTLYHIHVFCTILFIVTYLLPQTYFLSQGKQSLFYIANLAIKLYLCSETRILSVVPSLITLLSKLQEM